MHHRITKAMAVLATAAMTLLPASPVFAHDQDERVVRPLFRNVSARVQPHW